MKEGDSELRNVMRFPITAALLLVLFSFSARLAGQGGPRENGGTGAIRYYVTAEARLVADRVSVFGAANLPTGAVLLVNDYHYIGEGGRVLNDETRATVHADGLFEAELRPKPGMSFHANDVCEIVFMPDYPQQPGEVVRLIGRAGQRLGQHANNPEVQTNPKSTMLVATTVVTR